MKVERFPKLSLEPDDHLVPMSKALYFHVRSALLSRAPLMVKKLTPAFRSISKCFCDTPKRGVMMTLI